MGDFRERALDAVTTIRDVATQAGVSTATVSNFFHHPERMSGATRARIAEVVARLDFAPNSAASTLRRGRSPVVGYLAFELASARTPAIANAMSQRLAAADLHLLSGVDGGEPAREQAYLRLFETQRVAGVIVTPVSDLEPQLARLRARGLPSVLSARRARSREQPSVWVDHVTGGRLAAEHLLATGRRRIAFVTDTVELSQIAERFEGARTAIRAVAGARLDIVWSRERSVVAGQECARDLLGRPADLLPEAVICVNDLVALGLCHVLSAHLRVPDDVAVVGYDDIEFARLGRVPLTTVRTPQEELGTTAARLLLDEIDRMTAARPAADQADAPHVQLEPRLVGRTSTGVVAPVGDDT